MLKVIIDRDACVGQGFCVSAAPTVFQLDNNGKAILLDPGAANDDKILEAARSCPVDAIFLYDKSGKQIYP